MRRGEVRGLQWGDIGNGLIQIHHNWVDGEGLKAPKCKGGKARENSRTVPLPDAVSAVLDIVKQTAFNTAPNTFVFESLKKNGEPLSNNFFRSGFETELEKIGIPGAWRGKGTAPERYVNKQQFRNLTFHGLRHTFITLGRLAGITDLEIQTLAGHKSGAMMERYSHASQVIDFDTARKKIEKTIEAKTAEG
jgi:integrase